MTVAVGSMPSSGSDARLQAMSGKVPSGHRGVAKRSEDVASQPADETSADNVSSDELDASQTHVDKANKTSKRDHNKKDSDSDSSFADTFDTIGQAQSNDAGSIANKTEVSPANFIIAPMATGGTFATESDPTASASEAQQSAIRPTPLLQQKSILAIMDAKDRLLTKAGAPKSQDTVDTDVSTPSVDHPQDETDMIPMTVDRRETHWNFISNAMAKASSQTQALQMDDHKSLEVTATAGAVTAAPKEQTTKIDSSNNTFRQSVGALAATSNADQPASSSSSNDEGANQSGTRSQTPAASTAPISHKIADAGSASSLDQISTSTANPQPTPASPTTQVRDGVLNSLGSDNTNTNTNVATPDAATRMTSVPVMKTLDLTLSPPDLGSVKLRLSLKENSLTIEAEASKASTAKLLTDDRQNLERGLKDAGYDISSMKITDTSASTSFNGSGWQTYGSPSRDGDQSRSSFAGRQDGEMQRRDGSPSDQAQRRQKENDPQPTTDARNGRLGNAVYI